MSLNGTWPFSARTPGIPLALQELFGLGWEFINNFLYTQISFSLPPAVGDPASAGGLG